MAKQVNGKKSKAATSSTKKKVIIKVVRAIKKLITSRVKVTTPIVGYYFNVKIPGAAEDTAFQEVSGLNMEIRTEEIKEGGQNRLIYKVPQSIQYPNLVLKRGIIKPSSELNKWCNETIQSGGFQIKLKDITVNLLDPSKSGQSPLVTWVFKNAYPIKYQISNFNAERSEIAVETIELVYQIFEKK